MQAVASGYISLRRVPDPGRFLHASPVLMPWARGSGASARGVRRPAGVPDLARSGMRYARSTHTARLNAGVKLSVFWLRSPLIFVSE